MRNITLLFFVLLPSVITLQSQSLRKAALRGSASIGRATGGGGSPLFFGDGCSGAAALTGCTSETGNQNGLTGNSVAAQMSIGAQCPLGCVVNTCYVLLNAIDGPNPQVNCAIYSGGSGSTTKVCNFTEVTATNTAPTWQANTNISGCTLTSGAYVIAIQIKGSGTFIKTTNSGGNPQGFISSTYGTFPGTATWSAGFLYSIAIQVIPN